VVDVVVTMAAMAVETAAMAAEATPARAANVA
jgi:hypothetical protein